MTGLIVPRSPDVSESGSKKSSEASALVNTERENCTPSVDRFVV